MKRVDHVKYLGTVVSADGSCEDFLLCHTYDASRRDLLNSVKVILLSHGLISLSNEELLKVILYGHEQLPFDSNAQILTATLKYIQASKRFE